MKKSLLVFVCDEFAGTVTAEARASTFRYDPNYVARSDLPPVSCSWVKDVGLTYDAEAWLEGLLPENPRVRKHLARTFGAASTRAVDLLATRLGLECAGAVQVATESTVHLVAETGDKNRMSESDVEQLVDTVARSVPSYPRALSGASPSFSLAGMQGKVALARDEQGWYLPTGRHPTTHILKPSSGGERFPNLVIVEHVTMQIARDCGLDVAHTELQQLAGRETIIVERFDRTAIGNEVRRCHQEDLCQALGVIPEHKYEVDGGPRIADVAHLFQRIAPGQFSEARFFASLVLNWLTVSTDAHSKNYSFLLDGPSVTLSPLYDIASYLPYREFARPGVLGLAMRGAAPSNLVAASDNAAVWAQNAATLGLTVEQASTVLSTLVERFPPAVAAAANSVPDELHCREVDRLVKDLEQRLPVCRRVAEELDEHANTGGTFESPSSDSALAQQAINLKSDGYTDEEISAILYPSPPSPSWGWEHVVGVVPWELRLD